MSQSEPTVGIRFAPPVVEQEAKGAILWILDGCGRWFGKRGREKTSEVEEALKGSGCSVEAGTDGEVRDDDNVYAAPG